MHEEKGEQVCCKTWVVNMHGLCKSWYATMHKAFKLTCMHYLQSIISKVHCISYPVLLLDDYSTSPIPPPPKKKKWKKKCISSIRPSGSVRSSLFKTKYWPETNRVGYVYCISICISLQACRKPNWALTWRTEWTPSWRRKMLGPGR